MPKGNRTDYTFDRTHGGLLTRLEPADSSNRRRLTTNTFQNINGHHRLTKTSVCASSDCGTEREEVTKYTYWGNTNLPLTIEQTNGAGTLRQITTYTYDNSGRVLSVDGPLLGRGDAVYNRYDAVGRKTWEIGPFNSANRRITKRYTYRNQDDQVSKVEAGTLTSPTDTGLAVNLTTTKTYNSNGMLTKTKVASSKKTESLLQFSYDSSNRQICKVTRMNPSLFNVPPSSACSLGGEGSFGADRIVRTYYNNNFSSH